MNYYTDGFALLFDRRFTGWVRDFSPRLADHLHTSRGGPRSVLDLCCGTGVTAEVLCDAGWRVTGLDRSRGMLGLAADRLARHTDAGRVDLVEGDARDFSLPAPVSAVVCLDGALNHLASLDELTQCFACVAASLTEGGEFVFDLFEESHFRHWNNLTLVDEDDAMFVKRGVWDTSTHTGMLNVSGVLEHGGTAVRVRQVMWSRYYAASDVVAALEKAGLTPVEHDFEASFVKCESGSCSRTPTPCRTIYRAVRSA